MEYQMAVEQTHSENLDTRVARITIEVAQTLRKIVFRQRFLEHLCIMARAGIIITTNIFIAVVDSLVRTEEERCIANEYREQLFGAPSK